MTAKDIAHYVRQLPGLPWRVRLFYLRAALLALAARDVDAVNASVTPNRRER